MRHVPYHRAIISEAEIEEVVATLRSGWLTTGPRVKAFEQRFSELKGGKPAVALSSCTAGLFLSLHSLGLKPGDEVITTPMSFVATSNTILQNGGKVVFADISRQSMNIDPVEVERRIGPHTKAILPVHVGGNPCEMDQLMDLATAHGLAVIEDCAHAVESEFMGQPLGTFGYSGSFSFYPTKNITTGEGGMVVCASDELAARLRLLGSHGLTKGTWQRQLEHTPLYDVVEPGFKYNMTDLQAALGLPQLDRLEGMYLRRKALRERFDLTIGQMEGLEVVGLNPRGKPALHLYLVLLDLRQLTISRESFISEARAMGVELSVNYSPIHLFSWYRKNMDTHDGDFPVAEHCGASVLSLPFYPAMSDEDAAWVIETFDVLLRKFRK